jgi:hypothetical protein
LKCRSAAASCRKRGVLSFLSKAREANGAVKRRGFITLLSGGAAWPLVARGQPGERMRRIGVLSLYSQTDREGQACIAALLDTVRTLGWTDGRNVRIEYRWSAGDAERARNYVAELVALRPTAGAERTATERS